MADPVERTLARLRAELRNLKAQSLFKEERALRSPQGARVHVDTTGGRPILNMCANNYLGLADDPRIVAAARRGLDEHGFGMASVRFICGTHAVHRALEERISRYLRTEDTMLFSSCFDANAGLFEALLGGEDAIVSDALNHASIIDGIRLSKARRYRYANNDMDSLASALAQAAGARTILIATDGVFSMDGIIASLPAICDLAERYGALVMVDDSHAVGFIGEGGRGTPTLHGAADRVHILTGTLGKALGGASGGYVSGRAEIVQWLRQRARPYLFSNSLMPAICTASLAAIDLVERGDDLRQALYARTRQLRRGLAALGFRLGGIDHPIVPVLVGDAETAVSIAEDVAHSGIFVTPFSYPVVPQGQARIRMQLSAAHSEGDITAVIDAFADAGRAHGLI
jgi:glycine C-acetyltransferase